MRLGYTTAMLMLTAGLSQAVAAETAKTAVGKAVRVGYYSVFGPNCSSEAPPEIRITAPPKRGSVSIEGGTLTTTKVQNCPKISAPVRQIIYHPDPEFSGTDQVGFDVVDPKSGEAQAHLVTITVGTPPLKI